VIESCTNTFANSPLKSFLENSATEVVVNPTVVLPTPTLAPVNFTLPIVLEPVERISVLKKVFNTLISWSLSKASTGTNIRLLSPAVVVSVFISPNFKLVFWLLRPTPAESVDFSIRKLSVWVFITITSLIWVSKVSGSIICIK